MQQTTLDSSGQLQQAKGKLGTINVSELSLQELQAYTSVLNSIILSEKAELEASVLRKTVRSENYKFWAVIVAPVVAVLITALTLWFQIKQFGENTRLAKQTAEDTQWREALGKLFQREGLVSAGGAYLLRSFLNQRSSYQEDARSVGLFVLGTGAPRAVFEILAPDLIEGTDGNSVSDFVKMCVRTGEFRTEAERDNYKNSFGLKPEQYRDMIQGTVEWAGKALEQVLNKVDVDESETDLKDVDFIFLDLSHSKLLKMNLSGVSISSCSVEGADLTGIKDFKDSNWTQTAWWLAAKIHTNLLDYLIKKYPWNKQWAESSANGYYDKAEKTTEEQSKAAIERLRK